MKKSVIQIKNVSKHYGKFKALDKVDMTVNRGDIYGLVGKNGAGKTTLFKTILGLSDISEGHISILNSKNEAEFLKARNNIGFLIGQNFYADMNARNNINYYRLLKGIKDPKETERVLKIVGLDKNEKTFKNYSMGMKQRLGIASAILGNPEILILDEPINGLDPQGIKEIRALIKMLNEDYAMTIIISSHILSELDLVADRFGIVDHGVLIQEVEKANFNNKNHIVIETNMIKSMMNIFNTHNIKANIQSSSSIYIDDQNVSVNDIVDLIVHKEIDLQGIYTEKTSLEDLYFNLTQGVQNV